MEEMQVFFLSDFFIYINDYKYPPRPFQFYKELM